MFLMRLLIEEWNVEININGGFGWMRFIDGNKISAKGSDFLIMLITFLMTTNLLNYVELMHCNYPTQKLTV